MLNTVKNYVYGSTNRPIILEIDTTKVGVTDSYSFGIPCDDSYLGYNYIVDWGDGTRSSHRGSSTHTYSNGGIKIIKIYGTFPRFAFSGGRDRLKLLRILSWGSVKFASTQESAFRGCSNLTSIANDANWFDTITHGHGMFSGCSLSSIPPTMSLKNLIDGGRGNTGGGMFMNNLLTSLPPTLDLKKLETGVNMFSNNKLTELPSNMTAPKLVYGGSMFFNNIGITSLPESFKVENLENGDSMFGNCKLSRLPSQMNLDKLINGNGMFMNNLLTSLPSNMKLDNLETAGTGNSNGSMFGNNKLTDLPVGIKLPKLKSGVGMFFGVNNKINTERYSQLLIDMDNLNPNNNVNFNGGASKYNSSGAIARANLISKNWTVTDGGLA